MSRTRPRILRLNQQGYHSACDYLGKKCPPRLLFQKFHRWLNLWNGAFQKDIESFERLNTQVLGVSPDSIDSHYKFAEELNLTFPLISDPDKKLIKLYSDGRIAYLIDKKGIVQMIVKCMQENSGILQKIEQLEK